MPQNAGHPARNESKFRENAVFETTRNFFFYYFIFVLFSLYFFWGAVHGNQNFALLKNKESHIRAHKLIALHCIALHACAIHIERICVIDLFKVNMAITVVIIITMP